MLLGLPPSTLYRLYIPIWQLIFLWINVLAHARRFLIVLEMIIPVGLLEIAVGEGEHGFYLFFDGINDYVHCGNDASLNLIEAITIDAWVNIEAINRWHYIVHKQNAYHFSIGDNNKLRAEFYIDGSWSGVIESNKIFASSDIGRWFNVGVVYDGVNKMLYIDSELNNSILQSGLIDTNTNDMGIAARIPLIAGKYFSGSINEVRIYNRALGATEIAYNYQTSKRRYHF